MSDHHPPSKHDDADDGGRRVLTVLFCDVTGSTTMAEQLDPEDWADLMNAAYEKILEPVHRYGGTVIRLLGDAIIAMFGAPIAHEDDPERAVMAGLGIIESIAPLVAEVSGRGFEFNVRVGINTGLAVVGAAGSGVRTEYTAMGDAVNLAARMEQTAAPGTVQIAGGAHRIVQDLFDFEDLGEVEVKGKADPVRAFRVIGRKRSGRTRRGLSGMSTPLVGRDTELTALAEALALVEKGTGSIVIVIGEAGLGKSRLIEEARHRWDQRHAGGRPWVESRGVSYRADQAWLMLVQQLEALGYDPTTAVSIGLTEREQRAFATVLGTDSFLEGEALQREVHEATSTLFSSLAAAEPLVLVTEDVHWLDSTSIGLLQHLLGVIERHPLLLIATMRLDRQAPSWKLKQHAETEFGHRYTELTLKPLSPEESGQMVTSMLDISDLDPGARERILERTEGNPFFVEEVVRSLIDERLIEWTDAGGWRVSGPIEQFAVPDNIQALLLGRLDRLEGNVRRVIQVAAVIGRSFLQKVLAIVTPFDDRLESHLVSLERADLIRQVTRIPEPEFWFRHALTQEAAYNSILIKRRRQYHLRVAEALESLAGDQAESSASLLAHHFHEAGDPRAFGYLAAAGDAAFRLYGNHEAVGHYRRALDWVEHADHRLRTVFERLGRGLEILGRFEEALANYRDMIRYGESRRDQTLILGGRLAVAGVMGYTNPVFDPERARQEATEALSLAVAAADGPSEVKALRVMTTLGAFSGRPDEGISSGERAVEAARRLGLDEELAHTLNDLTWLYMTVGNFETAAIVNHEAVEWWIRLENQPMLADAYTSQGYLCVVRAEFPEALARADAIRAVSRPINNEWGIASAAVQTVLVCVETGDLEAGLAVGTEGLILAERVGNITAFIAIASQLALIEEDLGRSERADQLVSRADLLSQEKLEGWLVWPRALAARLAIGRGQLKVAASKLMDLSEDLINPNFALPRLELLTARAELAVVNGDADVGEKVIGRLLEYLTSNQIRLKLPEALGLQGRLLLLQGRPGEAAVALAAARGVALEQGADRALLALLRVLSQSESQGRNEALIAAGVVAERMAARITDSQLRALFLAHSEAAALGSWKGTT